MVRAHEAACNLREYVKGYKWAATASGCSWAKDGANLIDVVICHSHLICHLSGESGESTEGMESETLRGGIYRLSLSIPCDQWSGNVRLSEKRKFSLQNPSVIINSFHNLPHSVALWCP